MKTMIHKGLDCHEKQDAQELEASLEYSQIYEMKI